MTNQTMPHSKEFDAFLARDVQPGFMSLLRRLRTYAVRWWNPGDGDEVSYEPGMDRTPEDIQFANVVSSQIDGSARLGEPHGSHVVALDIDYPAHLIPSSTDGHFHLYLDVPGGVKHEDYMELLEVLGRIGVVEPGYADISIKRGHTDLRLPWISKDLPGTQGFRPQVGDEAAPVFLTKAEDDNWAQDQAAADLSDVVARAVIPDWPF